MIFELIIAGIVGLLGGLWLSKEAKSELKQGKKWFLGIAIVSVIALIVSLLVLRNVDGHTAILGAWILLTIVALISYLKA